MIVTVAELQTFGNVDDTLEVDNTLLVICLNAANDACEKYCGIKFTAATAVTEYQDAVELNREIYLGYKNVSTLTTLKYDSASDFGDDTVVSSDAYHLDTAEGKIVLDGSYSPGPRRWQAVYNGGWTNLTAPSSLRWAVLGMASVLWEKAKDGGLGLKSDRVGDAQISFDTMIPDDVKAILKLHKRYIL